MRNEHEYLDQILHQLTNFNFTYPKVMAGILKLSERRVNILLAKIAKDFYCDSYDSFDKDTGYLETRYRQNHETKKFLASGGYTRLYEEQLKLRAAEAAKEELSVTMLHKQIGELDEKIKTLRSTRKRDWVAIIISIIAALISALNFFH